MCASWKRPPERRKTDQKLKEKLLEKVQLVQALEKRLAQAAQMSHGQAEVISGLRSARDELLERAVQSGSE